jgi:uncharacterized 2Fe-2S/4Fe-4S cluster protein (DUF4445 family)
MGLKFQIRVVSHGSYKIIESDHDLSLLDILRTNGFDVYAPCGGKGTCGKCKITIQDEGDVISCNYFPDKNIEVILPGDDEANILVHQTEYLEDIPFKKITDYISHNPVGVAIDIGTTSVVLYFMDLLTGQIEKISSFLNPQKKYGADVISRINYCQEHTSGLSELQESIVTSINRETDNFIKTRNLTSSDIEKVIIAGNTTMLHIILGEDPISIAMAPFKPVFIKKQIRKGLSTGLNIGTDATVVTLPGISAFVGADIVAGLAALKVPDKNYLFIDIGTNGELALVTGNRIITCATAAGPAFEGANISCGMGAVYGAISGFSGQAEYEVLGSSGPRGICGSGLVDIVAYMIMNDLIDETGFLKETFIIHKENNIRVTQQDIREIQLAKSAIFSGITILMKRAGLAFNELGALYLAGGFGNYINIDSALQIGLFPYELKDKIYRIGNSAVMGALQLLKSDEFNEKINEILDMSQYIELSDVDEFTIEFAMNMNFRKVYT